ncbi:MAG: flagellar biosynthesis protein FlhB [Desulfobacterales bacterium]|jgi:flagellar biosynthetic protein FlhB
MPESAGQERTEQATPKRREEARRKGQVAQSREISSVMILMTSIGIFYFAGSWMFWNLSDFVGGLYTNIATLRLNTISEASALSLEVVEKLLTVLLPFLVPILIAGLIANISQIGFRIHAETMKPKLSKLNPIKGMKKFASLRSLIELGKSLVKILFIGGIAYLLVRSEMNAFPALIHQQVGQILIFIAQVAFKICFFVCLSMLVLAAVDFLYQRWQFEEDLKMTKQEVEDERKQTHGDPKVKARIRGIQLELARQRMMEAVPDADVVITNPTRLAIALKFDAQEMIAPRVLAKGAGFVAERIRDIAREYQVPMVEDKLLAQTLYKMVEIGDYIPVELYRAVAEVLAYVYRLKGMFSNN